MNYFPGIFLAVTPPNLHCSGHWPVHCSTLTHYPLYSICWLLVAAHSEQASKVTGHSVIAYSPGLSLDNFESSGPSNKKYTIQSSRLCLSISIGKP
jgi:hypothetical protein